MAQVTTPSLFQERYTFEKPNCMNRIMQWFYDDANSTVLKVGSLALAALALIGAGFLVGHPIVVPLLLGLPLAVWAGRECVVIHKEIKRQDAEAFRRIEPALAKYRLWNMKEAVGGEVAYDQLPVLELQNPPARDYIDWLSPEDLPFPVMKGEHFNRPFIAIKIKDEGVITFFRRYSNGPDFWTFGSRENVFEPFFGGRLGEVERAIIHQIVVLKNHPRFTLAE